MALENNISMSSHRVDTATKGKCILSVDRPLLTSKYDPIYRAVWCTIKSSLSPVYSPQLLSDIRYLQDNIAQFCSENVNQQPKYIVWMSDDEKIFSLGVDLSHIYQLIQNKDEQGLDDYMQLCMDVIYINLMKLDISPLITISLINGKVYGGGFESALSSDIVIAENTARCCFPEMRYHLLPSFGSLKMLLRRYDYNTMNTLIFESTCVDLNTLKELGFIESVVGVGEGRKYIQNKIESIHHKHEVYSALYEAKMNSVIITYKELDDFRHKWVKSAIHLKSADMKRLSRLVKAIEKKSM